MQMQILSRIKLETSFKCNFFSPFVHVAACKAHEKAGKKTERYYAHVCLFYVNTCRVIYIFCLEG